MMTLLAAALAAALSASPVVAPIGWGNGLTLPAQRHVVRLEPPGRPPYLLVAVQEDHDGPGGLNFWRSDDGGATWRFEAPIQPDWTHRDTADLVRVGDDVALVFSWEGPNLFGDARSDVWFQWWRMDPATGALAAQPRVLVHDQAQHLPRRVGPCVGLRDELAAPLQRLGVGRGAVGEAALGSQHPVEPVGPLAADYGHKSR